MEDDVLKLKEVVSVTFDTTPFWIIWVRSLCNDHSGA